MNFLDFLTDKAFVVNEAQTKQDKSLDISIPLDKKVLKKDSDKEAFLNEKISIVEKYDGTKLTIIRTKNNYKAGNIENNWIVAYKSQIMYAEMFLSSDNSKISDTIGIRWYNLVWEHLKKFDSAANAIPKETELFVEFTAQKDTLSRTYAKLGDMFLVGFAKTTYKDNGGKLESHPQLPMIMEGTDFEVYRKALGFKEFRPYFSGTINDYKNAEYILPKLKAELNKVKLDLLTPDKRFDAFKEVVLSIESELGGKSEGVVITRNDGSKLKFVQDDQYDKELRGNIKDKYRYSDKDATDKYWKDVNSFIDTFWNKQFEEKKSIKQNIAKLSDYIYSLDEVPINHEKRNNEIIRDDIVETVMVRIRKLHPKGGMGNALFIGRMQPVTKLHTEIIEHILKTSERCAVGVVNTSRRTKESPFEFTTIKKLLTAIFGKDCYIFKCGSGFVPRIAIDLPMEISKFYAGTDRVDTYKKQFENDPYVTVVEIPRVANVSGTQVREALVDDNEEEFKKLTDPKIHSFYKDLRKEILDVYKKLKIIENDK